MASPTLRRTASICFLSRDCWRRDDLTKDAGRRAGIRQGLLLEHAGEMIDPAAQILENLAHFRRRLRGLC